MHVQSVQKYCFSLSNMQICGFFCCRRRRGCFSSLIPINAPPIDLNFTEQKIPMFSFEQNVKFFSKLNVQNLGHWVLHIEVYPVEGRKKRRVVSTKEFSHCLLFKFGNLLNLIHGNIRRRTHCFHRYHLQYYAVARRNSCFYTLFCNLNN